MVAWGRRGLTRNLLASLDLSETSFFHPFKDLGPRIKNPTAEYR
jgi:hypothetical protein